MRIAVIATTTAIAAAQKARREPAGMKGNDNRRSEY
jgi:hypothetical protein